MCVQIACMKDDFKVTVCVMESFVLLNATFICQRRDHMRISHIIDTHT